MEWRHNGSGKYYLKKYPLFDLDITKAERHSSLSERYVMGELIRICRLVLKSDNPYLGELPTHSRADGLGFGSQHSY
jgi:hypothetical protein